MERRLVLAVTLMIAVLVVPSFFMKHAPRRPNAVADSAAVATGQAAGQRTPATSAAPARAALDTAATRADTALISDPSAVYRITGAGATIDRAVFPQLRNFHPGERGPASIVRPGDRLLVHRIIAGSDTIRFDSTRFSVAQGAGEVRLSGTAGAVTEALRIAVAPGNPYLLDVTGSLDGLSGRGATLVVGLGSGFANVEADSLDNYRKYAVAVRRTTPENVNFRSVAPGQVRTIDGPFDWVAVKSKYFMATILSADSARPQLGGAVMIGGERPGRYAVLAQTWVTMPVGPDGHFHYQLYLGPQQHRVVHPMGRELDRASPYGWIFKPIVMPVATWITAFFLWLHEHLHVSYGLILVLFGVIVRLALWPLNQRAMKSQIAMMAVQPILKDIQERYKNDPQKLQSEMMRVYKEHGVNPLGGCLPLFLPLPILLALFFVFSNTIELRGTPFLWLPDLSLKDPLFITPLAMGGSMFVLSKLSQKGMPPNPQAKMMTVFMPIMMTVMFMNFASGLNLYYAVSNLVSLPQQWLINKSRSAEMARRQVSGGSKS